jgi:hypothetical protein
MRTLLFASLALAAGLAACNPYDPNLGDTPFRCEPEDPSDPGKQRCPDGYTPVAEPAPVLCVCHRNDGTQADAASAGDGGPFVCNDDPFEGTNGNNNVNFATPTTIGQSTTWLASDVSICPDGNDLDLYSMSVNMAGRTITATVYFTEADGALTVDILNSAGTVQATGVDQIDQAQAVFTTLSSGTYYARVSGARNNYDLRLQLD